MKRYFKNLVVLVTILLFVGASIVPSISASLNNKDKAESTIWVFGLMKPLTTQSNQTKVFVFFALFKIQGSSGGLLKPFHYYYFLDCVDFSKKLWTICWCSNITDT
jgi:hypothetical protein